MRGSERGVGQVGRDDIRPQAADEADHEEKRHPETKVGTARILLLFVDDGAHATKTVLHGHQRRGDRCLPFRYSLSWSGLGVLSISPAFAPVFGGFAGIREAFRTEER